MTTVARDVSDRAVWTPEGRYNLSRDKGDLDPAVLRRREMEGRGDCSFRLPPGTAGSSSVIFAGGRVLGAQRDEMDSAVLRRREMEGRSGCSFRLPPGTAGSSAASDAESGAR
jgi:hypothetical protein